MASLRKRRDSWYARVLWYEEQRKKGKILIKLNLKELEARKEATNG